MKKTRTKFIIYPKFQWTLLFASLFIWGVVAIGVYITLDLSYGTLVEMGEKSKLPENHAYFKFVNYQAKLITTRTLYFLGFGLVFSLIAMTYLSHKFAGPLVRLKNHFTEIKDDGEYKEIRFRKGDYLTEYAFLINEALKRLNDSKKDVSENKENKENLKEDVKKAA